MNIQDIKELARVMQETGLTSLHVTEGALDIHMERKGSAVVEPIQPVSVPAAAVEQPAAPAAPQQPAVENQPQIQNEAPVGSTIDFNHITEVKSPMVGVFYAAPSPDAQPFVQVGSKVKKGDVLCIIEAMKLMNEITAEQDGEIVDICVKSGEVVEYSQTLFKIF